MEDQDVVTILPLESIRLPVLALRVALTCASDEETRFYLNGVHVQAKGDEYRIAATDGHRLFVYSCPLEAARQEQPVPEWAKKGVIIPREGLKERLSLLEKLGSETARIAYQVAAPYLVMSDAGESCVFKLQPIDGVFSDYQRVIDDLKAFEAHEVGDMSSTAYNAGYLREATDMAKALSPKGKQGNPPSVRLFSSSKPTEPSLFTFPECPFAILVLMPMRSEGAIGAGAARVLSGAVGSTIAALRAHQTRASNKGNTRKVEDYEKRIAAILAAANQVQALPAPEPAAEVEETEVAASYAIADAVEQVAAPSEEEARATYRRGFKGRAGEKDRARFYADVNAGLDLLNAGATLSQLADGVPVDDWYDAGVAAMEAAKRCLDWRRIGAVLPPDEVRPGEADLPVGLLQSDARPTVEPEGEAEQPAAEPEQAKPNGKPARDFDSFRAQVSAIIESRKGVSLDDLVDVPIRDWFDAGISAKAAAGKAIRYNNES